MKNLLALIDSSQISGPGRQLAALLAALRSRDIAAEAVTFLRVGREASPLVGYLESMGVPVTVLPERGPIDRHSVAALRHLVRSRSPAILQTHSYKATAHAWWLRQTGEEFKWLGCFHGATAENLKVRTYHTLDQFLLRRADEVVIMAESQRAGLGRAGVRAKVISNAVLPPPKSVGVEPPDWATENSQPVLGYVGRLSPEKGADVLLEALHLVRSQLPNQPWTAIIAGDGPERVALEARSASLGLTSRVRFIGQISDPWALYRRAQLIVLPSRSEGLPNVMLEAIAADLPVIATRVGAIPDVIGTSAAATLVPSNDAASLARAIGAFLTQPPDPAASVDRARLRDAYSLERRVAAHLESYRSLD